MFILKNSSETIYRHLLGAFGVFVSSLFIAAFLSHSLTPVYDGSALGDYAANPYATLSFAVSDSTTPSSNGISFSVSPGNLATKTVNLLAATDNETGYTLSLSDMDEDTALYLDNDNTSRFSIPSVATATGSLMDIDLNTYGYAFHNDSAFSPIPALSTPRVLISTNTYNTNKDETPSPFNIDSGLVSDSYNFTLGAKVDLSVATGKYSNALVFTLVANQLPVRYLQDLTPEACQALTLGQQYLFYDKRDEKDYTIAKLADGNCWMTSNLRLGNPEGGTTITLTSEDTNLQNGESFVLPTHTNNGAWGSNVSGVGGYDDPAVVDTPRLHHGNNSWVDDDLTLSSQSQNIHSDGMPRSPSQYIGNYYNWYTATAGTGLMANAQLNTQSSICPKGWKLPSGNDGGDFAGLMSAYNLGDGGASSVAARSWPLSFIISGYRGYSNANFPNQLDSTYYVAVGYWWTSTPWSWSVHGVTFRTTSVDGTSSTVGVSMPHYGKIYGFSVRCLLETRTLADVTYMQDVTSQICENTGTHVTAILKDWRDNKEYSVAKLADGNCWMTSNLRLGGTSAITLTDTLTDLADNTSFALPASSSGAWSASYTDAATINRARLYSNSNAWIADNLASTTQAANVKTTGTPASVSQYIGNYYNQFTATAGTGLYGGVNGNAPSSICPKNWRLPKSEIITNPDRTVTVVASEYQTLTDTYNITDMETDNITLRSTPFNFVLGGVYWGASGNITYQGTHGFYRTATSWYSSQGNEWATAGKYVKTSDVTYGSRGTLAHGYSMRCLAR